MMWRKIRVVLLALVLFSCSYPEKITDEGSGSEPSSATEEPETVSIAYLKSLYAGHPLTITKEYTIEGVVVSTDRHKGYYKTIVLEDGTGGIEIKLDVEDLFLIYRVGDILEVNCSGLTLGAYGGLVQLGAAPQNGFETGYIGESQISAHFRENGWLESAPEPTELTIPALEPRHLSCLVSFRGVQFIDEELDELWCDEGDDTDRTIEDADGNRLKVRVSHRAEFADYTLPTGSGMIIGILSSFANEYQLHMVDSRDAMMDGERLK